jgi:hypothetical protein
MKSALGAILVFLSISVAQADELIKANIGMYSQYFQENEIAKAFRDYRVRNPTQIQFLELNNSNMGISAGYHMNEFVYAGVIHAFGNSGEHRLPLFIKSQYGQDGLTGDHYSSSSKDGVELRFSKLGFYFSLGYLNIGASSENQVFDNRMRTLGNNLYQTGISVTVDYKSYTGPALGFGFDHVFQHGLSLGIGALTALEKPASNITLKTTNPNISTADIDSFKYQINTDHQYDGPWTMAFLALGYNF